jgi:ElaB/YqjD/DUF883 family membrane-anchored ribosome-binding protein
MDSKSREIIVPSLYNADGRAHQVSRGHRDDCRTAVTAAPPSHGMDAAAACGAPQQDRTLDADVPAGSEQATRADSIQQDTQFESDARAALDELGAKFEELDARNRNLQGESAGAWATVREEIVQAGDQLESDLDRLGVAAVQEIDNLRMRIASNLETITHRVERAQLLAADGGEEFVNAARDRLAEIDQDIQTLQSEAAQLPMEAREAASQSVETLRSEANDVREAVTSMAEAAPQQIAEQRERLADDVASLWASVRRETLEMKSELVS